MTEPNAAFLDGVTPTVTLSGKVWPIPTMAIKQNRRLHPVLIRLAARILGKETLTLGDLSEEDLDDLADAAFVGLTRAHPTLSRAEFEDMTATPLDLVGAASVILFQTGMWVRKGTASGEASGAATSPPISTESSPASPAA
ncbi:MAG: hypothetical protein V4564_07795 [Pseudomonadota bacterium]